MCVGVSQGHVCGLWYELRLEAASCMSGASVSDVAVIHIVSPRGKESVSAHSAHTDADGEIHVN